MPADIQCPTCRKVHHFKPEAAGRKVKCACGTVIDVPHEADAVDDLYELADEPSVAQPAKKAKPAAGAASKAGGRICPYCNQPIEASATLCVFCGSPLEAIKVAAVAPPVMVAPVKMRAATREEQSGKIKAAVMMALVAALLIGGVIGMVRYLHQPAKASASLMPGDAAIVAKIENEQGTEARDWLKANKDRMLGNWNLSQAEFHLDELYQMGAVKIYAFGSAYSTTIAIELPDDPAKRKVLFDWQTKWHSEMHVKPDIDKGQKWMEIAMRI